MVEAISSTTYRNAHNHLHPILILPAYTYVYQTRLILATQIFKMAFLLETIIFGN